MEKIKSIIISLSAAIGAATSSLIGGYDKMIKALIIFMIIDYTTGVVVALVFKNSPKTESGGASSKAGFKGLAKKVIIILLVMTMVQADAVLNTNNFFREAAIWGFMANELLSIIENVGLCGFIKLPKAFNNAIDLLNNKSEEKEDK